MKVVILILLATLISFEGNAAQKKKGKSKEQKTVAKVEGETPLSAENRMDFEFFYIEGLKEKMVGNPDRALQYFNQCLDVDPRSAATMFELANIYSMKGDFTSSQLLLEKAIEINSDNKWYKIVLAQIYQKNKAFEKASDIYSDLIKKEPDNVDYYFMNALLYTSGRQYTEAIKAYNQLEKLAGYNDQIAMARQQLYLEMGNTKEAYAEIQHLIDAYPETAEYYGIMADMYKEDGNPKKALEYYNKVLEVDPSNGFVHFSLTVYYLENKETDKAFEHAQLGFANPDLDIETKIKIYLMLTSPSEKIGLTTEQMETLIEEIEEAHPFDYRGPSIHADFLLKQGKNEEGRKYVEKALEINPNAYASWEQLIMIDNQLSDFAAMLEHTQKAIELFPSQPFLYILNGVAQLQFKNYDAVLKILAEGESYVADNKAMEAQFLMYEGEAYYNLDRFDDACAAFDKSIQLDPSNFMAMNNYAYYLSEKNEHLEKAEKMSSVVIQANPDNATYLDTHAWVLFRKKEYRLAKFYIETALNNGGDESGVIIEHYGDILFMLGETEKALEQWNKALIKGDISDMLKAKIQQKRYFEEEK